MEPITLSPGEHIDLVIDGRTVRIAHDVDELANVHAISLGGLDCELEGQAPGYYDVVPSTVA